MIQQPMESLARAWLPQRFGSGKARRIEDPIVEPLWIGRRVLVRAGFGGPGGSPEIVDTVGDPLELDAELVAAIADAISATTAVVDGYLTRQATRTPTPRVIDVETPSLGAHAARLVLGERRGPRQDAEAEKNAIREIARDASPLAFVAVDLLEIDGAALLDVPLLERKRLLESAVIPGELVRIGPYVRPPVDTWMATWRGAGFVEVAFKAANGRYRPGEANDDWAVMSIPRP